MRKIIILCLLFCSAFTFAQNGLVTTGENETIRVFESFSGTPAGGMPYVEAINKYKESMPALRVYSMIVPTAFEYYHPENLSARSHDEGYCIRAMYDSLRNVTPVDIVDVLSHHADEAIYARTDHHWLPLGAYYAAGVFAQVADVPFPDLSAYNQHVVHNFTGTMYKFSHNAKLKQYPEEFVFYTPKDEDYTTTFVSHQKTSVKGVYLLSEPFEGPFFKTYKDGSSGTYSTFMGGDGCTVHVKCFGENDRRLLIIKDSYGNAIPGYLFYSFSDIYVVDFRYFQKNIKVYIDENDITDLLFVNNVKHAYMKGTSRGLINMLNK